MAISLYLDTNVYLSFYHLTSEDLEELEKLSALTKSKEIILFLPQQTKDEFTRNRDVKIADAINRFKENKLNNTFPQICKDYDLEYKAMQEAIKAFNKSKQAIIDNLQKDIRSNSLKADKIINELFRYANTIKTTDNIFNGAKRRYDLGNPPGKKNSYGDAVNWETLLVTTDGWDDFYFISDDKDYYSEYDNELFNAFLLSEWNELKISKLKYYRKLSLFFKENYPDIKLATEYEKDTLITELENSGSFSKTRHLLYKLRSFESFSSKQVSDIAIAAISNNQVNWIGSDSDINEILYSIILPKKDQIDEHLLAGFMEIIPQL